MCRSGTWPVAETSGDRALPEPTPETDHYWAGLRDGRLLLQNCRGCDEPYFPPRPFCPSCGGREVDLLEASGKATLESYIISHRPVPGRPAPFVIAAVRLAEGPVLMTNIPEATTPEELAIDMPLEVGFEKVSETITLPFFRKSSSHA